MIRLPFSKRWLLACAGGILLLQAFNSSKLYAQNAQLTGVISDSAKANLPGATVEILNLETHATWTAHTNGEGFYTAPSVPPGTYKILVHATGFAPKEIQNLKVDVAGKLALNFELNPGNVNETVTVDASGIQLNTTDATVSTVIDRRFVENLPLNGRSFQSLMTMVPGVMVVPSSGSGQSGEISVNGQRTEANYFTIDGVNSNTGASVSSGGSPGAGFAGATPTSSALGTTQSMISIDALQEFRATTSTYSAEYGRTPGGQFQFNTRSGTNEYHGTAFNYLRNDVLDARNYFDTEKQKERQNDFGGALGGYLDIPKLYNGKDKTFFFFSYEALRLRNPTPSKLYRVPSNDLRATAPAELKPFLAAFPVSNAADNGNGLADYYSGYSAPSSLDTRSIRIDHNFSDRFKIFGRYSDSPSDSASRQPSNPSQVNGTVRNVKTVTLGATNLIGSSMTNDLRFNLTGNDYKSARYLDNFGGATPVALNNIDGLQSSSWLTFMFFYDLYPYYLLEPQSNRQRQINVVDAYTHTLHRHNLKYGIDYRRLLSSEVLPSTWEVVYYMSKAQVLANQPAGLSAYHQSVNMKAVFQNFSAYAQDEWKVTDRLNLSFGLRWELNPAPSDADGNTPYTLDQITNLSTAKLAPRGTPLWKTTYGNLAPRFGFSYQLNRNQGHEAVLRSGVGLFYDTGSSLGAMGYYGVGYYGFKRFTNTKFPLTSLQLASIPTPNADSPYNEAVQAFDPDLKLPYALQWNLALEQSLGQQQSLTINYVGSAGRKMLVQRFYNPTTNPNFSAGNGVYVTKNASNSSYNALQVRYQRALSHGLQALISYNWSHSFDDATSNFTIYSLQPAASDYDIRHNFQAALSYDVPGKYHNTVAAFALQNWALDSRISARSALPIDLIGTQGFDTATGTKLKFHPNLVPNVPVYLTDKNSPGGRRINYAAFTAAPAGTEGNSGRNSVRGFDAVQTDLTLRRDFSLKEGIGLQFRAEAYNLFNQAIFGNIYNDLSNGATLFGKTYNTESVQLGGLSSLYQVGGARSMQVALKLHF